MKNLDRNQIQTKLTLARKISEVSEDIQEAFDRLNEHIRNKSGEIRSLQGRHKELCKEANLYVGDILTAMDDFQCDQPEGWLDTEEGKAQTAWYSRWVNHFETPEINLPKGIERFPLDVVETLRNLPDRP